MRPDLIVLDLYMPVMNGFDAAPVLKRLMPTVPLIMYRAFGDKSAENQARLIGISEVVSKTEPASVLIDKARGLLLLRCRVSYRAKLYGLFQSTVGGARIRFLR